jgi:hypothetical protein
MKKLLLSILIIFGCIDANPQSLRNTNWSCYDLSDNFFRYYDFGTDTVFFSTSTTPVTAFAIYSESGNDFMIDALSGNCVGTTGSYTFSIVNDTLRFTVVNDACSSRLNVWGSYYFVRLITGIDEMSSMKDILVYPNPSSNGKFNLTRSKNYHSETDVSVFNILGEKVFIDTFLKEAGQQSLDLQHLPKGIYFLVLEMNNEKIQIKLVK